MTRYTNLSMSRMISIYLACILAPQYVLAQTAATGAHFEAASFKLSPPKGVWSHHLDPGRIEIRSGTIAELLWEAYQVWGYQVVWLANRPTEKYDLEATFPPGTPKEQRREMFQTLLAERLGFKVHRETRELSVLCHNGLEERPADAEGGFRP